MTVDGPKPLWTPSDPEASQLKQFENRITEKYNVQFGTCFHK